MTRKIKITDNIYIGGSSPIFIIAEAGVNHNGDINLAKKLIDAAKKSGADAVKFQTFKASKLVSASAPLAQYQKGNMKKGSTQLKMLKQLELDFKSFEILKKCADRKGIMFLSTPFDYESAQFLKELEIPLFKISSGDLTNLPFLEFIARYKKPLILSTGMSTLSEVQEAIGSITKFNKKLILLHCVSNYPASFKTVNLRVLQTLREKTQLVIGYSDHTLGIEIPIASVGFGAKVIEKHFTLDKKFKGPDHKASLSPDELKNMIKAIRHVELSLGDGIKRPVQTEFEVMKVVRKSLIAKHELLPGNIIKKEDIIIKRPGTGIQPRELSKLLGKKVRSKIKIGEPITWAKLKK